MFLRREERNRGAWYFDRYIYSCDKCGAEFYHAKKDSRIKLCAKCHKEQERVKALEKSQRDKKRIEELEKALDIAYRSIVYYQKLLYQQLEWNDEDVKKWKEWILEEAKEQLENERNSII